MSMVRHVPIRWHGGGWETDFMPPFSPPMTSSFHQPMTSSYHSSSLASPAAGWWTDPGRPAQSTHMDSDMRHMRDEMNSMFQNMQRQNAPVGNVDDWRLTENFRMENPVVTERDGTRKFKLQFDVRQFRPEEISVRTLGNQLTVQAKHEEKDSSKASSREYNRQFTIPAEVNPEALVSRLSADGVLAIEAPLPALEGPREQRIPIEHHRI